MIRSEPKNIQTFYMGKKYRTDTKIIVQKEQIPWKMGQYLHPHDPTTMRIQKKISSASTIWFKR